jgi:hypothetical protein
MDKIHNFEPNEEFPLHELVLTTPIVVSSDNFFIKYLLNNGPVYIQAPKCTTKQGIIKGSKKMYCDLLFTNENDQFIKWIEDLEVYSQKYIFKNRENWFESDLALDDIENSFTSSLKIFKSGKYYILRTIIPTRLGKCNMKLFDEDENYVDIDKVTDATNIIPILEFKGIRCSKINFQIDIEIKQTMILKPTKLFETCKIHPTKSKPKEIEEINQGIQDNQEIINQEDVNKEDVNQEDVNQEDVNQEDINKEDVNQEDINQEDVTNKHAEGNNLDNKHNNDTSYVSNDLENLEIQLEYEDIIDKNTMKISERNEVYYKIYQEAINKAKQARSLAISAYLEAKQIKNLYMLDDINENNMEDLFGVE